MSGLKPTLPAIKSDMKYLVQYLITSEIVSQHKIILMGKSLGGLFASYLSSIVKVKATVLLSCFYSMKDILKDKLGKCISQLVREGGNEPYDYMRRNLNKTLIIHGEEDDFTRKQHAIKLKEACATECELKLIPEMGHELRALFHDLVDPLVEYFERVLGVKYKEIKKRA